MKNIETRKEEMKLSFFPRCMFIYVELPKLIDKNKNPPDTNKQL